MLRLILLRHAKSSWNNPGLPDIDRPLNERGNRAAAAMAQMFVDRGLVPQKILCSSAQRTRETLAHLIPAFRQPLEVDVISDLYSFSEDGYLSIIKTWGKSATPLMVIGHNPATELSAHSLVKDDPDGLMPHMTAKFPTAAAAVIDFPILSWSDLATASGRLISFDCPRDLAA